MTDNIATLAAAALALMGVVVGIVANARVRKIELRAARELEEIRVELDEAKEIRAERRSKRAQAEATVSRYREPLLSATFDLQARIYNLCRFRFFGPDREEYHLTHTLYVFAQYFCWREIVRQQIQFLDLGDEPATKELAACLEAVTSLLARTHQTLPAGFKLFRGEQRALGEMMIVSTSSHDNGGRLQCLGYADFVNNLRRTDFSDWFNKLEKYILELESRGRAYDFRRLVELHRALISLMDTLDPGCLRFPEHLRKPCSPNNL